MDENVKVSKVGSFFKAVGWAASYFLAQSVGLSIALIFAILFGAITPEMSTSILESLSTTGVLPDNVMLLISELSNYSIILALIPYVIIVFLKHKKGESIIRKAPLKEVTKTISMGFALSLGVNLFLVLAYAILPESIISGYSELMNLLVGGTSITMCLAVGIVAPIVEEIVFRYGALGALEKAFSPKVSLVLQALFFGIIHGNLIQGTYAFVLGLALGYLYNKSNKNLLIPILIHFTVNMSSCIFSLLGIESLIALPILTVVSALITFIIFKVDKKKA